MSGHDAASAGARPTDRFDPPARRRRKNTNHGLGRAGSGHGAGWTATRTTQAGGEIKASDGVGYSGAADRVD